MLRSSQDEKKFTIGVYFKDLDEKLRMAGFKKKNGKSMAENSDDLKSKSFTDKIKSVFDVLREMTDEAYGIQKSMERYFLANYEYDTLTEEKKKIWGKNYCR